MFFLVEDTKAGKSLAVKLSEQAKPGALIPVTKEEMEASKNMRTIGYQESNSNCAFVPLDPNTRYLAIVDKSVNVHDLTKSISVLGVNVGIVRTDDAMNYGTKK